MQGFKTEGVVLKRRNFGEADRILTIFSLHRGKISVMAKGVRKITSRRAGNIELLNRVQMYLHQGKTFLILTEASSLDTYANIKADLALSTYAYHIIELVDKLTAENQVDPIMYQNILQVLARLNNTPRQIFVRAFEVKTLSHLGFFSFLKNEVERLEGIDQNILEKLAILEKSSWDEIDKIKVNANEAMELERVLRYHIEKVIEGSLKSRQFLKKV